METPKVRTIPEQPTQKHIMINNKQPEYVGYLKYLGSVMTGDATCTRGIKYGLLSQKQLSTGRILYSQSNCT
jgi:hypothetical protein